MSAAQADTLVATTTSRRGDPRDERLVLVVTAIERSARDVATIRMVDRRGDLLPSFTPGSHVVVECGGRRNAYSLVGDFLRPTEYAISVLRLEDGEGGSRWLHDEVAVGDELLVAPPRSAFAPVTAARHHVLVAGGIGITPLVSHARASVLYGRSFELLYAHRRGAGAHVDELRALCGERLTCVLSSDRLMGGVRAALADRPLGTVLYVCGPGPMIDAVLGVARELGWPDGRLHTERFSVGALDPGRPFTARLAASGRALRVASGVSLLEVLEGAGLDVPSMCRQGVCGECRVGVRGGRPEHRDLFLSPDEREAGDSVMCCVSRSHDDVLELDL